MTDKQRDLVECMNELCQEQCPLDVTKEEAQAYISRNIEEYKLEMEIRSPNFGYS